MDYTPFPVSSSVRASLVINSLVVFVAVLVVILRYTARLVAGARLGWDDYLMLAALPQGIGLLVCLGLWAPTGLGHTIPAVLPNYPYIFTILLPFQLLFVTCITTVKMSVLIFYCRVFTSRAMRLATKFTIVLVAAWGLGNLIQTLLVCHISDGKWTLLSGGCSSLAPSNLATGVFNCTTDVIIALLPLYTIWSLPRVSVSSRLHLSAVFLLGTIVTVVSIIRIWYLTKTTKPPGTIEAMPTVLLLTATEANLSIITNSSPMLLPLYTWWKYRRVWGEGADDYVSRLRGSNEHDDSERLAGRQGDGGDRHRSAVENLVNGVPLETIYGVDHVHFTATVIRGNRDSIKMTTNPSHNNNNNDSSNKRQKKNKKKTQASLSKTTMDDEDDGEDPYGDASSESESTRRLPNNAQTTGHAHHEGIQIETKWSITEETVGR